MVKGRVPEWPNGADCKSAGFHLRWFESIRAHNNDAEVAQLIEHQPSKLRVASLSLVFRSSCLCSSGVEHFLGKEEVAGSNPAIGSKIKPILTASIVPFSIVASCLKANHFNRIKKIAKLWLKRNSKGPNRM